MSEHTLTVLYARTNTKVGRFIRFFTVDDVNHCAVFFDGDPSVMYSYRRESLHNIFSGRFGTEQFTAMSRGRKMLYETVTFDISQEVYDTIFEIFKEQKDLRYLIRAMLRMKIRWYYKRTDGFVCSTFAAYVLKEVLELKRPFYTYTPVQLRDETRAASPDTFRAYYWTKENSAVPLA